MAEEADTGAEASIDDEVVLSYDIGDMFRRSLTLEELERVQEAITDGVVASVELAFVQGLISALRAKVLENWSLRERAQLAELRAAKDMAYRERNKLVAALSKLFHASLERHPDEDTDWEDDWRWVVFIDLPTGQVSWHIHDSELDLFDHLPRLQGRKWDGHSTEEKYERLARLEPKLVAGLFAWEPSSALAPDEATGETE